LVAGGGELREVPCPLMDAATTGRTAAAHHS
jgi:hypothetical protein